MNPYVPLAQAEIDWGIEAVKFGATIAATFGGASLAFLFQRKQSTDQRRLQFIEAQIDQLYFPLMMKYHTIRHQTRHRRKLQRVGGTWANFMSHAWRNRDDDAIAVNLSFDNILTYYNEQFFKDTLLIYAEMEKLVQDNGTLAEPSLIRNWHHMAEYIDDWRVSVELERRFREETAKLSIFSKEPRYPGPFFPVEEAGVDPFYNAMKETCDYLFSERDYILKRIRKWWNPFTWKKKTIRMFPTVEELELGITTKVDDFLKRYDVKEILPKDHEPIIAEDGPPNRTAVEQDDEDQHEKA